MLARLMRWLRREDAFTLIELMIVILVILILAAILIPQFGLARERARKASCVSNQRNIETAVAMWATDNPNINYTGGTMAATSNPNITKLTSGTPSYTSIAAFVEPDDSGANATSGVDYFLYDGIANATPGSNSPEYGHVACAFDGFTDPWVDNQNTATSQKIDHRRNPSYTP